MVKGRSAGRAHEVSLLDRGDEHSHANQSIHFLYLPALSSIDKKRIIM
jgi:hypothetical protein